MVSRHVFPLALLVPLVMSFSSPAQAGPNTSSRTVPSNPAPFDELVIPVGPGPEDLNIQGGGLETLPWGPNSFVVAAGRVYVLDGVASRIQVYDPNARYLVTIPLPLVCTSPTDLRLDEFGNFWVLDQNAQVFELDATGQLLKQFTIPTEVRDGVTGLILGQNGDVFLKIEENKTLQLLSAGRNVLDESTVSTRFTVPGVERTAASDEIEPWKLARVTVKEGSRTLRTLDIGVDHLLGSASVARVGLDGSIYVEVQELLDSYQVTVDKTVRKYDQRGRLLGTARVPLEERFANAWREVDVDDQGNIYALIPKVDGVVIKRLDLERQYSSWLNDMPTMMRPEPESATASAPTATQTRTTALNNAKAFRDLSWTCSSANYSRSCGDGLPRFITASGKSYTGVPYKWGGGNCTDQYLSAMASGNDAGDTCGDGSCDSDSTTSCSYGVDCSGFANRVWSYNTTCGSHPFSTSSVGGSGIVIKVCSVSSSGCAGLHSMDTLVNAGSHMVMFDAYGSGGEYAYEATKSNSYDRVVRNFRSWSNLSGYIGYEYKNISPRYH